MAKKQEATATVLDKISTVLENGSAFLTSAQSITMMVAGIIEANKVSKQQMKAQQEQTPYQVLGVMETATDEEIKAIYRTKAKFYHPDKGGDTEIFQKIKFAYNQIKEERGIT